VGTGAGPFPGVTIADGTDGPKTPVAGSSDSRTPRNTPDNSKYGFTVTATGTSGGGLKDYGIFRNESVYTVYIEIEHSSGAPAPAWILQYARLRPTSACKSATTVRWD
jgi:hypothetical protein